MPDSRPEQPTITVEGGSMNGFSLVLIPGETVMVGISRQARLRLDHPEFAYSHLKIAWDDLGVWITDMDSGRGTWLNGEPIQAAPLGHGDVVRLADPKKHPTAPSLRIGLPQGLEAPDTPLPLSRPEPGAGPTDLVPDRERSSPPAGGAKRRPAARRARASFRLPSPLQVGAAAAVLLVLGAGTLLVRKLVTAPGVESLQPAAAEAGRLLTITGSHFSGDAAANTVWFGDMSMPADSVAGNVLQVKVPTSAAPGNTTVVVQTSRGRSRPARFRILQVLRATELVPEGALSGDEVALRGEGFAAGVAVSVGGVPAEVLAAEPHAVRFRVPALTAAPASRLAVVATIEGRSAPPLMLVLGRLPLVETVVPPRAAAGEVVRLRGVGFSPDPESNVVTFDGAPALVAAASRRELAVVTPLPVRAQAETLAALVVQALGATSEPRGYPLLRLVEGTWVPRCLAVPLGEGAARGQVLVGTEIGPLFMLSWKDESASTAARALSTCAQVDAALNRARVGERVSFESREDPSGGVGVGVAGRADMVVRVTPQDAAAYERPPGVAPRRDAPTPDAVARHWAALLNDLTTVATSGGAPTATAALSPLAGKAFADLRAALPWQYGAGLSNARVAALPAETRRRLREIALAVP